MSEVYVLKWDEDDDYDVSGDSMVLGVFTSVASAQYWASTEWPNIVWTQCRRLIPNAEGMFGGTRITECIPNEFESYIPPKGRYGRSSYENGASLHIFPVTLDTFSKGGS